MWRYVSWARALRMLANRLDVTKSDNETSWHITERQRDSRCIALGYATTELL